MIHLPGIPPAEEQASKEATAEVLLLFDDDDAVTKRIVDVIRTLFLGGALAAANCETLLFAMLDTRGAREAILELIKETSS